MSVPPILRPLAFGEVLDSAFTLYRRNFAAFVAAALGPTLLMLAVVYLTGMQDMASNPAAVGIGEFALFGIVLVVVTLVMWGALAHMASQAYGGAPTSAGEGFRVALGRFFPLLGATLLAGILGMLVGGAIGLAFGIVAAVVGMAVGGAGVAVMVAAVMVLMLGLYALAAGVFFALVPAVVVEGKGPVEAIGRSLALARGAVGRLVGLMLVCFLIVYLPILGVAVLTGTFTTLYDPAAAAAAAGSPAYLLQQVVTWSAGALTTPFLLSVIVVQYYDRRVRTEALDVQAMADRLAMA